MAAELAVRQGAPTEDVKGLKDSGTGTGEVERLHVPDRRTFREAGDVRRKFGDTLHKSLSLDLGGESGESLKKFKTNPLSASIKRKSVRRRASVKRFDKQENKFGHDKKAYESIRERVLQERAVVNAIEALQERWKMLMFMFDDCEAMNETRKHQKLAKLTTKRQEELLMLAGLFLVLCVPVSLLLVLVSRLR